MKRIKDTACAIAASLAFAVMIQPVQGQTLQQIERDQPATFVDGVESYIYGYLC